MPPSRKNVPSWQTYAVASALRALKCSDLLRAELISTRATVMLISSSRFTPAANLRPSSSPSDFPRRWRRCWGGRWIWSGPKPSLILSCWPASTSHAKSFMRRDARAFLWDVQHATDAILRFTAGLDARAYADNEVILLLMQELHLRRVVPSS